MRPKTWLETPLLFDLGVDVAQAEPLAQGSPLHAEALRAIEAAVAEMRASLVAEKLISKRLITFNLCDDGSNFDTEFATCFQASAAIDQVVAIAFQWADQDRHTLTVLGNRVLQALNFNLKPVIQPSFGNNLPRIDLKNTATQSAPFKSVRSVAKGLQRQAKFRLSCHSAPMCSG